MTFPRYVLRTDAGAYIRCDSLVEAFDQRAKLGGIVYEPLALSAAERIAAEPDDGFGPIGPMHPTRTDEGAMGGGPW